MRYLTGSVHCPVQLLKCRGDVLPGLHVAEKSWTYLCTKEDSITVIKSGCYKGMNKSATEWEREGQSL